MLGPVTCQACGAKVREDRVRCLRCGEPLLRGEGPALAAPSLRTPAIGVVAAVVLLGGLAAVVGGRAAGAPVPVVAPAAASAAPLEAAPASASGAVAPDPTAVSMDVSRVAMAKYNAGDVAGALEQFSAAVAADPDNGDALNNLGQLLVRGGRALEAIPYFDRAIAASGSVWAYHFNRARAYAELKEWSRSVAGYRDAARLFPDDYVTAFNLGRALQADGKQADAIVEFQRAVALAPGEADFSLALANALDTAQRPQEAATAYRRYLELQETAPQADKIKARIAQLEGAGKPAAAAPGPQAP